tara:strand:+ start:3159 stop:3779 length:621 start_codon:yes stop_codon:yes gene_type:complete
MPTTKAKATTKRKRKVASTPSLKYYKLNEEAREPVYATDGSACFDIYSNLFDEYVTIYNTHNEPRRRDVVDYTAPDGEDTRAVHLNPGDRIMVPTGLILDIPESHYVRLFARSGISLYSGLSLVNSVGIIDSDYKKEIFVILENKSSTVTSVTHHMRICQGIMTKCEKVVIEETTSIEQAETRDGGFGSTGVGEVSEGSDDESKDE